MSNAGQIQSTRYEAANPAYAYDAFSLFQRACTYAYDALAHACMTNTYDTAATIIVIAAALPRTTTPTTTNVPHRNRTIKNARKQDKHTIYSLFTNDIGKVNPPSTRQARTYGTSLTTYSPSTAATPTTTYSETVTHNTTTIETPPETPPTTHPIHHYYGYRYYSPELGRWPSRDPIGEWGGININNYVSNDPGNNVDPDGLADYDFSPDPVRNCGYTYEDLGFVTYRGQRLKVLGEVRKDHFEVFCTCSCSDGGGYEMYCRLYMWIDMFIDRRFQGHDSAFGVSKRGVYGHEQKHITSMQELVLSELMPALNRWESLGHSRTRDRCESWAHTVMEMAESRLDIYWRREARHANPGSPGRFDSVEPIDGVMP